jgi:energy-converting hydrogenase Eha subunit A
LSLIIAVALISLIALAVLSSTIVFICLQRRRMPKLRGKQYLFNNVNCFLLPRE